MTEKLFPHDVLSKRERIERALNGQPTDRAPLHDQLSFNPAVIAHYTGRPITGFDYTRADVGTAIRQTLDACFLPIDPLGHEQVTNAEGFTYQNDEWNASLIRRPFSDVTGARKYLQKKTAKLRSALEAGGTFNADQERRAYRAYMQDLQSLVGETVVIDYSINVGFCDCWYLCGLDLFSYLWMEDPQVIIDYITARTDYSVRKVQAAADPFLSPVVLIAEDFASKGGSIFSPALLRRTLFPNLKRLVDAWHTQGLKVLYHSDGNWKRVIPDLAACGVDGFYCLETSLGMDLVELHSAWPLHTWAGGVDGVDLMERGSPEDVRREVHRQIVATNVLQTGRVFIGSSSEINPPIPPDNFQAMVRAVGEFWNQDLLEDD